MSKKKTSKEQKEMEEALVADKGVPHVFSIDRLDSA